MKEHKQMTQISLFVELIVAQKFNSTWMKKFFPIIANPKHFI